VVWVTVITLWVTVIYLLLGLHNVLGWIYLLGWTCYLGWVCLGGFPWCLSPRTHPCPQSLRIYLLLLLLLLPGRAVPSPALILGGGDRDGWGGVLHCFPLLCFSLLHWGMTSAAAAAATTLLLLLALQQPH